MPTRTHVADLVKTGARCIAEGVQSFTSQADLARQVGSAQLNAHILLEDRHGNPDLRGLSKEAKEATHALFSLGRELLLEAGYEDADTLIERLQRAVHNHKSDVRADFLRSLDEPGADLSLWRGIVDYAPTGVPPSAAVAAHYGVSTKGRRELERESKRLRNTPPGTAEERATLAVGRMLKAASLASPKDFEELNESVRERLRGDLEDLNRSLRAMRRAAV